MKIYFAFFLIPLSMLSYFVLAVVWGVNQKVPIPHFVMALVGLYGMFYEIRIRYTHLRLAANLLGWVMALLFAWWILDYSAYDSKGKTLKMGDAVGSQLSSVRLQDSTGQAWTGSQQLEGHDATLLVFFRGHWCPFCIGELSRLEDHLAEFTALRIGVVALSMDSVPDSQKTSRKIHGRFPILSDPRGELVDLFGVRHQDGNPVGGDIARSASYLIGKDGAILWADVSINYRLRPQPEDILSAAKAALK